MARTATLVLLVLILHNASTMGQGKVIRSVVGAGAGKYSTVGQSAIGRSSSANILTSGFWYKAISVIPAAPAGRLDMKPDEEQESAPILFAYDAFPNPASNSVLIYLNANDEFVTSPIREVRIETYSPAGSRINETTNLVNDDFTTTLSLDGFPNGLLIIRITHDSQVKYIKIIKE